MGYVILMLTNYFHDLAVALLAANVIVVNIVGRYLGQDPGNRKILTLLIDRLSRVTWYALAYVILAGAVRMYFFMEFEWNPLVPRQGMLVALGIKHVLLIALTVFGILGKQWYKRRYSEHT